MHVSGHERRRELPLHSCTLLLLPCCKAATASLQLQVCKCQQGGSSFFASSCVSVVMTIDSEAP